MKIKCHIILDRRSMDIHQNNAVNEPIDTVSTVKEGTDIIWQKLGNDDKFIEINSTLYNKADIVSITVFEDE